MAHEVTMKLQGDGSWTATRCDARGVTRKIFLRDWRDFTGNEAQNKKHNRCSRRVSAGLSEDLRGAIERASASASRAVGRRVSMSEVLRRLLAQLRDEPL